MTEWTQKALRAEAQKRLNDAEGCEYFAPDDAATILVAELIGRCEEPPVDPLLIEARYICSAAMGIDYTTETTVTRGALLATYNGIKRGMALAERMGK